MGIILLLMIVALVVWIVRKPKGSRDADFSNESIAMADSPLQGPTDRPVGANLLHLPVQFVVFDLETTGLDPRRHEIIEIGAIRVNRDSVNHDTFEIIVRPHNKVPAKITQLTGITQAMADSGDDLDYSLRAFCKFVGNLPLVAFNAEFDMAFLLAASSKCGIEIPNRVSCALKMARSAWPGRTSYRLSDLARDGNLSVEDEHRSLGDCKRALIVYTAAASRLGTTN